MLLCFCYSYAQETIIQRVDSVLGKRYFSKKFDTAYVFRPWQRFRFTTNFNNYFNGITWQNDTVSADFKSNIKATVSFNLGYRGFVVGFAINPARISGKYKDTELDLRIYSRSFGGEIAIQHAKTFTGKITQNDTTTNFSESFMSQKMANISLYYVFNNKKFSYPAAFTYSYVQKKNCGSLLFGYSMIGSRLSFYDGAANLDGTSYAVGAGYGYNFVGKKGLLFHISSIPMIIVYQNHEFNFGDEKIKFKYQNPEFIITGRAALVYNFKKIYTGFNGVFTNYAFGDGNGLTISYQKYFYRIFWGVRF